MAPKSGTVDDLANYLATGYWRASGSQPHHWNTSADNVITVNITGLNGAGQSVARAALDAWEMVADIQFREVTGKADITFDDNRSGANTSVSYDPRTGDMIGATVYIGSSWLTQYGSAVGSYGYQTYVHEIGHALGLGHPGTYGGGATYSQATWTNDSWQLSVMSYLDQDENPNVAAGKAYVVTPMMADIIAIQQLYGKPSGTPTKGDTTYGEGTNLSGPLGSVFGSGPGSLSSNALTIFDEGGTDTFNFTATDKKQTINLNAGTFSSVYGQKDNVGIARGTTIEKANGGRGTDDISGNSSNNNLKGNAGTDSLKGNDGNDVLYGGDGTDSVYGGKGRDSAYGDKGNDRVEGGDGDDFLYGGDGNDTLYGGGSNNSLNGAAGADRLDAGTGNDVYAAGGGVDTLIFRGGTDRITDFRDNEDTILFSSSLWGGGGKTADQILRYGQISSGDAVFTFSNGQVLRVENVTSLSILKDDIAVA